MSSFLSVNAAFAMALASQADSADATRLDTSGGDGPGTSGFGARLYATVDPPRAAFVAALRAIDAGNAPLVAGPYVAGAASGPLTETDIFDPSRLYHLPGQDLAVSGEETFISARTDLFASFRLEPGSVSVPLEEHGDMPVSSVFEDRPELTGGRAGAAAMPSTVTIPPGSRLATDLIPIGLEGRPSAVALERAMADYLGLLEASLSSTKRKVMRRPKASNSPSGGYRAIPALSGSDVAGAEEKGSATPSQVRR